MSASIPPSVPGFCLLSEGGSPGGPGEAVDRREAVGVQPRRVEGLAGPGSGPCCPRPGCWAACPPRDDLDSPSPHLCFDCFPR